MCGRFKAQTQPHDNNPWSLHCWSWILSKMSAAASSAKRVPDGRPCAPRKFDAVKRGFVGQELNPLNLDEARFHRAVALCVPVVVHTIYVTAKTACLTPGIGTPSRRTQLVLDVRRCAPPESCDFTAPTVDICTKAAKAASSSGFLLSGPHSKNVSVPRAVANAAELK